MKDVLIKNALAPTVHPAIVSLESFKLVFSMENDLEQDRQAEVIADLLETIKGVDEEKGEEILGHIAELQGVPAESLSMESLGTVIPTIRSLFGWGSKKREPEVNKEPRHYKELMEFLNKYYLNQAWLSKQTFVEGPVSGAGLAEALTRNNRFDPNSIVADLTKYAAEFKSFFSRYMDAVNKHSDQIEAIDDQLVKDIEALSSDQPDYEDRVMKLIRDAVKKMKSVSDPVKMVGSHFKLLGNRQTAIKQWRYSGDPGANCDGAISEDIRGVKPIEEVPAIDPSSIKALIDAVVSLYETTKMVEERMPHWCDHSDGKHGFMKIPEAKDDLLWSQYGSEMYWQGQARRLVWDLGLNKNCQGGVIAVLKWIDRSIKTQ